MPTTIITKNGSDAPADGDLSIGELAIDLTNKQLYTKNSDGVIKLGSSAGEGQWTLNGDDIYYDTGNVGIGDSDPSRKLSVVDSRSVVSRFESTGAIGGQISFSDSTTSDPDGVDVRIGSIGDELHAFTGNQPRLTIDDTGNVGVGTDSPATYGKFVVDSGNGRVILDGETTSTYNAKISPSDAGVGYYALSDSRGHVWYNGVDGTDTQMAIDRYGNVGIGSPAVSGVGAPLDVDKVTPFNNCLANFGEFIAISGYQRGVVNINGRVNGTDYDPSLSFVRRTAADSNWLNARILYNADQEFVIEKNGQGGSAPAEAMRIEGGGQHVYTHSAYGYGAKNYFINGKSTGGSVYIGNVNGSLHLASGAYYYGGSLRKLDADATASAGLYLASDGSFNFQQITGAEAGSNATAVPISKFDTSGNFLVGTGVTSGRLTIKGETNTSAKNAVHVSNSDGTLLVYVRNDGVVNTGTDDNSPYNFTTPTSANLVVTSAGTLQRSTSSARYKENIRDYDQTVSIDSLRPVFFNSKNEDDDKLYAGLIAEEVHEAGFTEFVEYNDSGEPDAVFYANMVALCIKEIQELKAEVASLKGA